MGGNSHIISESPVSVVEQLKTSHKGSGDADILLTESCSIFNNIYLQVKSC